MSVPRSAPSSSSPATLEAAAEWLRKRFDAEAARGVVVAYELDLAGPEGGVLSVRIDDGHLEVRLDPPPAAGGARPDARLRLAAADFYGILAGRENSEMLFMANRIQVEGDLAKAVRFRKFFPRRA